MHNSGTAALEKIVVAEPEARLVEHLKRLEPVHRGWQVAVIHGSELRMAHRQIIRMRESQIGIESILRPTSGIAYLCADADIIFLFPIDGTDASALMNVIVRELLPFLSVDNLTMDGLVSFYPLGVHYDAMLVMAQRKKIALISDNLTKAAQQQNAEALAKQNYAWNAELFSDALKKRSARKEKLAAIIEDDATLRQVAREVLRAHYGLIPSADGYEGLEMYNTYAPDLVFLDIELPHIHGLQVLNMIMQADPQANIIMVTSHNQFEILQKAMQLGAKGFVTKPFTTQTLLQCARKAVG